MEVREEPVLERGSARREVKMERRPVPLLLFTSSPLLLLDALELL